jgi:ABC-type bacteriocin/lantibiotic exporter with double-glycine peptidase domain
MKDLGALRELAITLAVMLFVAICGVAVLFVTGYELAALAFIAIAVMLWHLLLIVGTIMLTARFVRSTMEAGANVALQAQSVDGKWDAIQATSYTKFASELLKLQASHRGEKPAAALPMFQQNGSGNWLPDVEE